MLSEFRSRLVQGQAEQQLLDTLLERCRELELIRPRGRQRTDSTHVLAAVRVLNRLERVGETMRAALNDLAVMAPDWLQALAPAEWYRRDGRRVENYHLPKTDAARDVLAWEGITDDTDTVGQLEESQRRALGESLKRAKADLKESIWRAYRHLFLLNKTNAIKVNDLGQINSSMAPTLPDLIVNTLKKDDELTDKVGSARLVRFWPPALTEWATKAVRDAFFASPALPRLIEPGSIKQTIADGVSSRLLGYARKEGGRGILERFGEPLGESEVEISEDFVLLKAEDAQKLLEPPKLDRLVISPERVELGPNEQAQFTVKGFDQYEQPFAVEECDWTAGAASSRSPARSRSARPLAFSRVLARCGDIEGQAQIRVTAAELLSAPLTTATAGAKTVRTPKRRRRFAGAGRYRRRNGPPFT